MSDTYTAWDGNDYPLPPPDGWTLQTDGRYWPPTATTSPAAPTPPGPAPQPMPAPQPQSQSQSAQPFGGPPGNTFPNQDSPAKKSNTALIVLLTIFGFLVLVVGGCVVAVAGFFNTAGNAFEELEESIDEFEQNQIEARGEVSIDEGTCRVTEGKPTVTLKFANRSGGRSDYTVVVHFNDDTGRRLQDGFADVDSVDDGRDVLVDVESFETGIEGTIECEIGDVTRYSADLGSN